MMLFNRAQSKRNKLLIQYKRAIVARLYFAVNLLTQNYACAAFLIFCFVER